MAGDFCFHVFCCSKGYFDCVSVKDWVQNMAFWKMFLNNLKYLATCSKAILLEIRMTEIGDSFFHVDTGVKPLCILM